MCVVAVGTLCLDEEEEEEELLKDLVPAVVAELVLFLVDAHESW